ncbi:4'-phosphopantetheinyl transferase family protein [Proteiniclasticum ruminis]|uniref:4'-phosphopantetheinyl transferase superfamily protein n=1 Tax=Proteiniclasticum ruminis TaxID=398199 RepID=A0A1I4XQN0_9CLOT|nr:4'-phosphopantetheinyl transferase superfamily protein [Proteiniclasticum ruminis]SFN28102.1 4'-phosphopantetheinyl transferase superfamily protein [Proteiniclasticum ruminis]
MIYLIRLLDQEKRSPEDLKGLKKRLISYGLQREYGLSLKEVEASSSGALYLRKYPEIHLSTTCTKGLLGIALSACPVGLDAEYRRPGDPYVEKKILGEKEAFFYQKAQNQNEALLKYFTLKEAYGKALGTGLSYDFRNTGFYFDQKSIKSDLMEAQFYFLDFCEEFIISLCFLDRRRELNSGETVRFILP